MMIDGCDPEFGPCISIIEIPHDTNPVIVPQDHVNDAIAHIGEVLDLIDPTLPLYDLFGTQMAFDDGLI